jgi:hypothetical protein
MLVSRQQGRRIPDTLALYMFTGVQMCKKTSNAACVLSAGESIQ